MNVLSLFDGMSCGQIALNRAGIKYDNYFASEIKKHAIEVTQHNYPNTIQLGDVTKVKAADLPKIDLLIGGSPCQDFSIANRERLGLKGQKSSLFYEYLRLLKECIPKYFLLENVSMNDYSLRQITQLLGAYPVNIDSYLVSGAYRNRYYWTNINQKEVGLFSELMPDIATPKDKGIKFQDVLESGYTDKLKARSINTHNGNSEKNQANMYRRYKTTGMDNIVFLSPDFDWTKGVRFLTQTELERLMTVPEGYTKILNVKKAHNLLGDGWTVDVIAHIFSHINK